jgi:citrate lyase subunit beta / citryl-CoA lyase
MTQLPRSYLFVPGDRPGRFAKALATAADAVIVDLEDAVAPEAKSDARDAVAKLMTARPDRSRLVVRINDESTPWFEDDVRMLRDTGVASVLLPKAERRESLQALRAACIEITLLGLIESAKGVLAAGSLATAPGMQRLVFGTIDYALDMGLEGDLAATVGLDFAATRIALACRAAAIGAPVAGVTTAIDEENILRLDLERARAHGFSAKLCIHPKQVSVVHDVLRPSKLELAWAERVIEASVENNGAAIQVDGRMIDKPVIERARRVVQRAR